MRIFAIAAVCGVTALLVSTATIAQTTNDSAPPQPTAAMTKAALHSQNRQLSKAVRRALHSTKGLNSSNIAVLVKGGTVSLVGTVTDDAQIQVAGNVTKGDANVTAVDNRLIVAEEGAQ